MQHIEENLLDQYAQGTLSGESLLELEEHLLVCSFCQRRLVQADELLILFREAAVLEDVSPPLRWFDAFAFRASLLTSVAAALSAVLILLITGGSPRTNFSPAIVLMQSLRGPEGGAQITSAKPSVLVFDMDTQGKTDDYEIEIVDAVGNKVLNKRAQERDGRLATPIENLSRGSYWVRLYRNQPGRELLAEYSLRAD